MSYPDAVRDDLHLSVDEGTGVPLYVQLREQLRTKILAEEWDTAEPLPTEEALAKSIGVSRSTARQALDDLSREGLIVRRQGRGTFVRPARMILRMQQFMSFHDEMIERGLEPSSRLVWVKSVSRRRDLELDFDKATEKAIWIRTLRLANGRAAVLFDHFFPASRCGFLLHEPLDLPDLSLRRVLASHGIMPASSSGEIRAAKVDAQEAELLEMSLDSAVVEIITRTADQDGRSFEHARSLVRPDRYALLLQSDWAAR